ncbi:LPXTG cell wall anchor domain-containing protein [Mycetocola saprophilus]|uniref:LPXTG cell wall anchor domain-containing protein n=1 Tax=Mycetocola saprophilus TaxID=76636 RepID=UPI0004BFA503|nr:LPXTG cell wall anchor domain-containing protein [Mycetocola saprophilus]
MPLNASETDISTTTQSTDAAPAPSRGYRHRSTGRVMAGGALMTALLAGSLIAALPAQAAPIPDPSVSATPSADETPQGQPSPAVVSPESTVAPSSAPEPQAARAETPIQIPDAALRACINAAIGQPAGAAIVLSQVSDPNLRLSLKCLYSGISDLTGIEAVTGARFIDVSGNNVSDVSALGALGRNLTAIGRTLSDIHVENNHIADLSTLKDLVVQYYFFTEPQLKALPVAAPLTKIANPIRNQDGTVIVPTSTDPGFVYDAATNTFTFATPGPKTLTWTSPLTPGSQNYPYNYSGTLTVMIQKPAGNPGDGGTTAPTDPTPPATPGTSGTPVPVLPVSAGGVHPGSSLASTGLDTSVPLFATAIAALLGLGGLALGLNRRRRAAVRK